MQMILKHQELNFQIRRYTRSSGHRFNKVHRCGIKIHVNKSRFQLLCYHDYDAKHGLRVKGYFQWRGVTFCDVFMYYIKPKRTSLVHFADKIAKYFLYI